MFDDLKEKISELKLKSSKAFDSLKARFKKNDEEDSSEWEEETEEVTSVDSDSTEIYEDEDEDVLDENSKKEKKNRNIRIALGIIAVLVLSSDYWLDPLLFDEPQVKPIVRKRPKKVTKVEKVKVEETNQKSNETVQQNPPNETKEISLDEIESKVSELKKQKEDMGNDAQEKLDVAKELDQEINVVDTQKEVKEDTEQIPPEVPASVLTKSDDAEGIDFSKIGQAPSEEELKKKEEELSIKEKDYISPPNYRLQGRGLVYNCKEKYWACVGKISYFQCGGNEQWAQKYKEPIECVTRNVYASLQDCETVQEYYVNNNEPTDFCGSESK